MKTFFFFFWETNHFFSFFHQNVFQVTKKLKKRIKKTMFFLLSFFLSLWQPKSKKKNRKKNTKLNAFFFLFFNDSERKWLYSNRHACEFFEDPRAQDAFKISMIHVVLQFTLSITVRCVLHRCESQDIHC